MKEQLEHDTISYLEEQEKDIEIVTVVDYEDYVDTEKLEKYLAIVVLDDELESMHSFTYKKDTYDLIEYDMKREEILETVKSNGDR